jgi:hypothetical protein
MTSFSQSTHTDTAGQADEALRRVRQSTPCPVYAWCAERGDHVDHIGTPTVVPSPKHDEPPYLDAFLLHLAGGQPIIGLGGADLTPAQARTEANRIRAFADQVDAMANALEATTR